MSKDKLATAKYLAKCHSDVEPKIQLIRLIEPLGPDEMTTPVRLLEVVEDTIERGIEPIEFSSDPDRGIHFNSAIIEVSPKEYQEICDGKIKLENNWSLGETLFKRERQ